MANSSTQYAHRRNEDGSYDTICRTCFAAIARSKPESELAVCEKTHHCDSSFLAERGYFNRAEPLAFPARGRSLDR
jgi:hypothetical protein